MEKNTENIKKENKIRLGITHGDINGISYELIIKTFMEPKILDFCTPIIYGSLKVFNYYRKLLGYNDFSLNVIRQVEMANPKRPHIINCTNQEVQIDIGESTKIAGKLSLMALKLAINDAQQNKIDAIVTLPINKSNIQSEEFNFHGHTEYFAKCYNVSDYLMLMLSNTMKIGFVTEHCPVARISDELNSELIFKKLKTMNDSLLKDFTITKPKIAVLSLNPHAGDEGLLGNEEKNIIIPAIKKAFNSGILAIGPFSADGFFGMGHYRNYDAVLAMYHDQGMIPFKGLSQGDGVNYTAGLPIVRTSPAHGTAYDIAGKNVASPDSFRNAIYLACDIYKNKLTWNKISSNPLKNSKNNSTNNNK